MKFSRDICEKWFFEVRFQLINERDYKFGNSFTFCTILITFYLFIFISFWLSRIYPMPLQTNGQLYFFFYFLNVLTYSFYGRPVSRHCANRESEVIELVTRHLYILYMYVYMLSYSYTQQTMTMSSGSENHHIIDKTQLCMFWKIFGEASLLCRSPAAIHIYIYYLCVYISYLLVPCI